MKVSGTSYDFNTLKPHVSRCLLRQLCKRIVNNPFNHSFFDDQLDEVSLPNPSTETHHIQRFYGALIFVDISGFTALSTRLDIESLTTHINDYFKDMLAIIENFGGDVVKFAGDAMYVVWHAKSHTECDIAVHRAVACAKEIVRKCNNRSVSLSPTTSDASTPRRMFKKLSLAQSLLSGHSALERDNENDINTTDDEEASSATAVAPVGPDEGGDERSPRNSGSGISSRRSSVTAEICATKIRRLSMPSQMITSGKNIFDVLQNTESEVASLNVHIGISTGIVAGVDVGARGKSEFFLTGQPLLDVAAAESLAKLGQIVVSQSVYDIIHKTNGKIRQYSTYKCVSTELGCYRIEEPITLSTYEMELQDRSLCNLSTVLSSMMSIPRWNVQEEYGQRIILLKLLSSYVHEAARMQSVIHSRASSPPPSFFNVDIMPQSGNGSNSVSCSGSVYGYFENEEENENENEMKNENFMNRFHSEFNISGTAINNNGVKIESNNDNKNNGNDDEDNADKNIERSFSFDDNDVPDESLSAELRELVVLFIKVEVDVTLSHCKSASSSLSASSSSSSYSSYTSSPLHPSLGPAGSSGSKIFSRPSTPNQNSPSSSPSFGEKIFLGKSPAYGSSRGLNSNSNTNNNGDDNNDNNNNDNNIDSKNNNCNNNNGNNISNNINKNNNDNNDKIFQTDEYGFIIRSKEDNTADICLHTRLQTCMTILADTFAEHGGQIGTYSCCDKGNVCLATFGLRGSVQEDNAAAAIESAQTIIICLQAIGLNASIGVASGKVYGGLVGSPSRHEYSIMGPAANLSARLMCAASVGTILCENETRNRDRSHLFIRMPMVNAKGYTEPVVTYQPVLSESSRMRLASRRSSYADLYDLNLHNKSFDTHTHHSGNKKYMGMSDDGEMSDMIACDVSNKKSNNSESEALIFGRDNDLNIIVDFLRPTLSDNEKFNMNEKNDKNEKYNQNNKHDDNCKNDKMDVIIEVDECDLNMMTVENDSNNIYKSKLFIDVNVRGSDSENENENSKKTVQENFNIIEVVKDEKDGNNRNRQSIANEKMGVDNEEENENENNDEDEKAEEKDPMKIAIVTGACGCGKTIFLAVVRDKMAKILSSNKENNNSTYGDIIFSGGSNSYDTTVPFNSWRPVLTALFITVSKRAFDHQKEIEKNEIKLYEKMLGKSSSQMLLSPSSLNSIDWKASTEKRKMERRGGLMRDVPSCTSTPSKNESMLTSVLMSPHSMYNNNNSDHSNNNNSSNNSSNTNNNNNNNSNNSNRNSVGDSATNYSSVCNSRHSSGASQSTERSSSMASTFPRLNHLKNGILLITASLPQNVVKELSLVYKLLPSFAKTMRNSEYKIEESALVGTAKLTKTVEVLSALIQTAVDLLRTKTIFITL